MPSKRSHGEGTLRHRSDGRWELRMMDGYQKDGSPRFKTFYGKTQKEVKLKLKEYQDALISGVQLDTILYFEDWADTWFEGHKDNIAPTTQESYKYCLKMLKEGFYHRPLTVIRPIDIENFLKGMRRDGRSDSYISKARGMLYQIFQKAEANDLVRRNPVRLAEKMRASGTAKRNEKKQLLLAALEKSKEPTLSDLLVDYFNLRNEQRSDWSGKAKLKCTVRDFEEVKRAVDYLKAHSLNTVEDLNQAIDSLNQTVAPLRKQLKQNENRMRAIAQIKDAAAAHAKLKPIHDTFIKRNFKLTKDAYAAQHKDELDAFNKAVRTLMKLNGSTAVDVSALDAEFSALQSSSAELRTQLETLQPDISALKNIRKYIDMVLNKQQLSAPGGKTPEKESVLKKLEQFQQKKSHHKTTSTPPNREESL